jgi:hypothetical protein
MALDAVHASFQHGMMLWQLKLYMSLQMTLQASSGIFSWIEDKFSSAATTLDVFAPGSMTSFAAGLLTKPSAFDMHSRMRAGRKHASYVRVAIEAGLVADVRRTWNVRRGNDRSSQSRTGEHHDARDPRKCQQSTAHQLPRPHEWTPSGTRGACPHRCTW